MVYRFETRTWLRSRVVCALLGLLFTGFGPQAISFAVDEAGRGDSLAARIPSAATRQVGFTEDIQPILETRCLECHARGKGKGEFHIDTREMILNGSENGRVVVPGNGLASYLLEIVGDPQAESPMPPRGDRLSGQEVALLRAWIDQGMSWREGFTFARFREAPLALHEPPLTGRGVGHEHPLDRLVRSYFLKNGVPLPDPVEDRLFLRRATLDVIGLPPSEEKLEAFLTDSSPDKRAKLVEELLADRKGYAEHWISFWNDLLRNDYTGTGYIDGGRAQITDWLFTSLEENKPYDQFVRELIAPTEESLGFIKGIVWRGVTNSSQTPEMQASQNIGQVFMGINLKCASCHDSFTSNWKLEDSYALANVFAAEPLQIHRCDSPTGDVADTRFLYQQLGSIDPSLPVEKRQEQLATIVTSKENGRFARTLVNRLWARLMGHGLVEPTDEMDRVPWDEDVLDWLANDFVQNGFDIRHTMKQILTSKAYQMPAVSWDGQNRAEFVFKGPTVRRLTAEQFRDALCFLSDAWIGKPSAELVVEWQKLEETRVRSWALRRDPLTVALGRPNRDQINSQRPSAATTLQGLELTNGAGLARLIEAGAERLKESHGEDPKGLLERMYMRGFSRPPTEGEVLVAREILGATVEQEAVQDLLWVTAMSPEFQLVY